MALVEFKNFPDLTTPLNATNLNNNFTECFNIIESGSNANGSYIKYSDGTLIQRGSSSFPSGTYSDASYKIITFPTPFYDKYYNMVPYIIYNSASAGNTLSTILTPTISNVSTSTIYRRLTYLDPNAGGQSALYSEALNFQWIAIGRWKA